MAQDSKSVRKKAGHDQAKEPTHGAGLEKCKKKEKYRKKGPRSSDRKGIERKE